MSERAAALPGAYFGGRLIFEQMRGYRAAVDPILLAASLSLRPGAHAVEFGCNAGAALLSAAVLHPGVRFTGIEQDADAAALAQDNIARNALGDRVRLVCADALSWRSESGLDAVFFNPPFFDDPDALRAPAPDKRAAWINEAGLAAWITAGLRRLREGGRLTLIQRADRLGDILAALDGKASAAVLPIHPRAGAPAKRVVVSATKVSRAALRIFPGLVLHEGEGGAYMPEADAILRGAARTALAHA